MVSIILRLPSKTLAKHGKLIWVGGAFAAYAILVLGALSLPPNIPPTNLMIVLYGTIALAVFLIAYFAVYYGWWNRRKGRTVLSGIFRRREPSFDDTIAHSAQKSRVLDALSTHYHGIIGRMETWDYQPCNGEQIFIKATAKQPPESLKQDKEHLESFESAWNLYSDGPTIYGQYKQADDEMAKKMLDDYLMNVAPNLSDRLQRSLPTMIAEKVEYATREYARNRQTDFPPFKAKLGEIAGQSMVFIDDEMLDVVGEHTWTLDKGKKLASAMNGMIWKPDILYVVHERGDALAKIRRNRNDFLSAKDELVRKARSVDCHLRELTEGECDDCKFLKENLKSLGP